MSVFVLLIDNNDGVMLVGCPDEHTAERVGMAAVWSDGGVSAYRIPEIATAIIGDFDRLITQLEEGRDVGDLLEEDYPEMEVMIG